MVGWLSPRTISYTKGILFRHNKDNNMSRVERKKTDNGNKWRLLVLWICMNLVSPFSLMWTSAAESHTNYWPLPDTVLISTITFLINNFYCAFSVLLFFQKFSLGLRSLHQPFHQHTPCSIYTSLNSHIVSTKIPFHKTKCALTIN